MIEILGNPASPYSRKLIAALRYRRVPHVVRWGMGKPPDGYPAPKVPLMPVAYMQDAGGALVARTDTTPILQELDVSVSGRALIPNDPATAFLNALIEDYADEWLTKCMFHFRWSRDRDAKAAGALLSYLVDPKHTAERADTFNAQFSARQISRLPIVGASALTGPVIEASYLRFLSIFETLIEGDGFIFGSRPSTADFAIYGQLTQLALCDPTPAEIVRDSFPRIHAWMMHVEDLSGIEPTGWHKPDRHARLIPLLSEISQTYAVVMRANAAALMAGDATFSCTVDGTTWTQDTFPYQAKCLTALKDIYAKLDPPNQKHISGLLADAGTALQSLWTD